MWSTWKTHEDLTFKPGWSQNDTFEEETGGRELSFQNKSLPFKTGELEHMHSESTCCDSLLLVNLKVSTIIGSDGVY